jgi:hypothetical protein
LSGSRRQQCDASESGRHTCEQNAPPRAPLLPCPPCEIPLSVPYSQTFKAHPQLYTRPHCVWGGGWEEGLIEAEGVDGDEGASGVGLAVSVTVRELLELFGYSVAVCTGRNKTTVECVYRVFDCLQRVHAQTGEDRSTDPLRLTDQEPENLVRSLTRNPVAATILLPPRAQLCIRYRDCSKPGEDPNAWKQFGSKPTWAIALCRARMWPGRRGILGGIF